MRPELMPLWARFGLPSGSLGRRVRQANPGKTRTRHPELLLSAGRRPGGPLKKRRVERGVGTDAAVRRSLPELEGTRTNETPQLQSHHLSCSQQRPRGRVRRRKYGRRTGHRLRRRWRHTGRLSGHRHRGAPAGTAGMGGDSQTSALEVVWSNVEDGDKGVLLSLFCAPS